MLRRSLAFPTGSPRLGPLRTRLASPRFWAVQGLVALVAEANFLVDAFDLVPRGGPATFLLESLFIIPVIYAALHFGLHGTVATAIWCTLVMLPNWMLWHEGAERIAVITQLGVVFGVAAFVGNRRDRERAARTATEDALRALRISEEKYRALFETAGEGILAIDGPGTIAECNAAAGSLLGRAPTDVIGKRAAEVLPSGLASALERCVDRQREPPLSPGGHVGSPNCADVTLTDPDGHDRSIEPVCTMLPGAGGLVQFVLRDVTEQKQRQAWLETYAARLLQAQEEERRRIAQEIHDDTVQSLFLLGRELDAVEDRLAGAHDSEPGPLHNVRLRTESTLESLRTILFGLRPSVLDDLGLTPAIGRLVRELDSRSAIEVSLVVRGQSRRLPGDCELAMYRIGQEALRNMERHSGASQGTVTLRYRDREVELSVADDGRGFSPPRVMDPLTRESKLGVLGMHERARIVGGTLEIRSRPGAGTTVIIRVPVCGSDDEPSPSSARDDGAATLAAHL
jgi:two-component system sensor histidine kinase NreB